MRNIFFAVLLGLFAACNNQPTESVQKSNESQSNSVGSNDGNNETLTNNSGQPAEQPVAAPPTTSNEGASKPAPVASNTKPVETAAPVTAPQAKGGPKVQFEATEFDYGTIKQGDKVTRTFVIKNVGGAPLEIKECKASCGCTQPEYSFQPIMPGEKSDIKVTFDSKNKEGNQKSTVTVITNSTPAAYQVYMTGVVEKKAE